MKPEVHNRYLEKLGVMATPIDCWWKVVDNETHLIKCALKRTMLNQDFLIIQPPFHQEKQSQSRADLLDCGGLQLCFRKTVEVHPDGKLSLSTLCACGRNSTNILGRRDP